MDERALMNWMTARIAELERLLGEAERSEVLQQGELEEMNDEIEQLRLNIVHQARSFIRDKL